MHKLLYSSVVILLFCFSTWSCDESAMMDPNDLGNNYFPLETGQYGIFKVNETIYNSFSDSVQFSYWLKVSVKDSFKNLENGISYTVIGQKKKNEDDDWVSDSIWTARKYDRYAVSVENNIPIVSLTFPVNENKTWDGNKLNNKEKDLFEMVNVNKSYENAFGAYPKTVTVIREDIPDVIVQYVNQREIFAEGIGTVFKENSILKYRQGDFLGKEVIESGHRYIQYLVEYGEE